MILRIIQGVSTIIANIVIFIVLRMEIYTDRARMADGSIRVYHKSPLSRLEVADRRELWFLQLFFIVISCVTGILLLCGVKNNVVRIVQLVSSAASIVMFIVIMVVSKGIHPHY